MGCDMLCEGSPSMDAQLGDAALSCSRVYFFTLHFSNAARYLVDDDMTVCV